MLRHRSKNLDFLKLVGDFDKLSLAYLGIKKLPSSIKQKGSLLVLYG
ncbi:hypothetical protein K710_1669 [Streptococcus iniae SF1]|nr:hypothetical protein K710_1669 [Streptococcus iniae SF1]EKB51869.1 hypothetical protein A0G_1775 [Streptococcus iniae 9117]